MRSYLVPALLVFMSCSTPRGLDPSRLPSADEMILDREIRTDFNHDHSEDSVRILPPSSGSEYHILEISLSDKKDIVKIANRSLVYAFSNPGASLELLDNGSFKVIIDHSGAGRSASLREYTVSFRDEKFILSGITISEYDRIDPELGGSCDINLLTGEGERNGHPIKVPVKRQLLEKVNFDWVPKQCKF